jgi:hypothetical protein
VTLIVIFPQRGYRIKPTFNQKNNLSFFADFIARLFVTEPLPQIATKNCARRRYRHGNVLPTSCHRSVHYFGLPSKHLTIPFSSCKPLVLETNLSALLCAREGSLYLPATFVQLSNSKWIDR